MVKKVLLTVFLVLVQTVVFGATISSTSTGGNWSATTTWVGGVVPTVGDNVIIANGSTVTMISTPVTLGTFTIYGQLVLLPDISHVINTTSLIVVSPSGSIKFDKKSDIKLPSNTPIQVGTGGLLGDCSNNNSIFIGTVEVAVCVGGGNTIPTFAEVMDNGGYNVVNVSPSSSSVCGSGSFSFTVTALPSTGATIRWFTVSSGGTSFSSANPYTPTLSTTTTYYVEAYYSSTGFTTPRKAVVATVNPNLPASVIVSASANPFCPGTSVTFTATPTNGGTTPTYQWKLNGGNVGTNTTTYTNATLSNNDIVTCVMTSNATCATGSPATSNTVTMAVNASLSAVTVTPNGAQTICDLGIGSLLTAAETGGGVITSRQWGKRSTSGGAITAISGATSSTYTPTGAGLTAGTWFIVCSSTPTCGSTKVSNEVKVTVNSSLTAIVSIAASPSVAICAGTSVTFTATPTNGGTTPTYQWKLNGGNVGTNTTTYTNATLSNNDIVTCVMTSNATPCLTGSPATSNPVTMEVSTTNTWTGTTNASWFTASNWSCGVVPLITSDVIIPDVLNKPVIDGVNTTALANTITVNQWSSLTVLIGNTLKITDKLTNNNGTITFLDDASLVQINNVTTNNNIGVIDYNRTTYSRKTDYTYWSSPVSGQTLGVLYDPYTLNGTFYSYEATAAGEDWSAFDAGTDMVAGKGYIANQGAEIPTGVSSPPSDKLEVTFSGIPNNGHYEINGIFADKSYLLGNPYPSALDADTFLAANGSVLDGTLYFWTHNTAFALASSLNTPDPAGWAYSYTSDDYATYNNTGGTAAAPSSLTGGLNKDIPNGKIASGQGFFASSKTSADGFVSGTPIVFNNNMRVGVIDISKEDNSQFFKSRNPKTTTKTAIEKNRIWLNLTNTQGAFKQTLVGYITDATNDYDDRFDGESFDGNEFVDFYSVNQDKNLVIQGRALPFDENDEVPLGYRTTINGDFTINIGQADGSLTNQAVYIEDKLTNTVTDLKIGNYTFNTVAGTFNNRFVLRYKDNSTAKTLATANFDSHANKVLVSNKNKQIKVNSFAETIDKVTIYDLAGRQIYQKDKVDNNELTIANLVSSRQTLVVKTVLQNGTTATDKIIY